MCSTLHFNQSLLHQQSFMATTQNYNIYRSKKISPTRRLKNLLKPLLRNLFFKSKAKQPKRNSYIATEEPGAGEFDWLHNDMDNRANEQLEQQLYDELCHSRQGDAIIVYDELGAGRLAEIDKRHLHVPVHFARTNAGTFFWTSLQPEKIDPLHIEWNFMDRWAQA